jgi:hypothetical protein
VPVRVLERDQDGQLEQFAKRRPAELAEGGLGNGEVAALDRTLKRCSRMSLRGDAVPAFPGPDGG